MLQCRLISIGGGNHPFHAATATNFEHRLLFKSEHVPHERPCQVGATAEYDVIRKGIAIASGAFA